MQPGGDRQATPPAALTALSRRISAGNPEIACCGSSNMNPSDAVLAFNRFGLGARAGDLERIGDDPVAALADEIADKDIAVISDPGLLASNEVLIEADAFHQVRVKRL